MSDPVLNSADDSFDGAVAAMPDIEAMERSEGRTFEEQAKPEQAQQSDRDEQGRFKAKQAEAEAVKAEPAEAEDDDPEVEFPAEEEGKEPVRERLSKVWEGYRKAQTLEQEVGKLRLNQPLPEHFEQALTQTMQERAQLAQIMQALSAQPQVLPPSEDLINPISPKYDPTAYYQGLQNYRQSQVQAQEMAERSHALQQQSTREQEALLASRHARERAKLLEAWPELKEEAVARSVREGLGKHYGLDDATVNSVLDHRFYKMAKDALAFRAAQAKQAEVVKAVKAKPKLIPGAARQSTTSAQRRSQDGFKRLQQSGSLDDAAAALDGLF